MSSFRRFGDGQARPATWAERGMLARLRESGAEDVYVEPSDAPQGFWNAILAATYKFLMSRSVTVLWDEWADEMTTALGLSRASGSTSAFHRYETLLGDAYWLGSGNVDAGVQLSAVEFLLDVIVAHEAESGLGEYFNTFVEFVNERARWFRVGVRLEGNRFVPTTSELLHVEVVQPTLLLLSDRRFADVDSLYRKGFDRALAGDASGAVTAAISAVEEMLRVQLPEMIGQTLGPLAEKARKEGLITGPMEAFTRDMYGLRPESDAHSAGTTEFDAAMLALHLAGSLLLYLGRSVEGGLDLA